jgi:hypothetical protein
MTTGLGQKEETLKLDKMRSRNRTESDFQPVNVMLGLAMGEWAIFVAVALASYGGLETLPGAAQGLAGNLRETVHIIVIGIVNFLLVWNLHSFYNRVVVGLVPDSDRGRFLSTALAPVTLMIPWLSHYFPSLWVVFVGMVALAAVGKNIQLHRHARAIGHPLAGAFRRWVSYGLIYALTSTALGVTVYGVMSFSGGMFQADAIVSFFGPRGAAAAYSALQTYTVLTAGATIVVYYAKNVWYLRTSSSYREMERRVEDYLAEQEAGREKPDEEDLDE